MAMSAIPDEEEVEEQPGLTTIPILPEDYPLFSWDDWPESRAALVSGTPTKYFAKETWNAIVDAINDALGIAGVDWYDPRLDDNWDPYTVDDSKILRPYGQLTAEAFNTVCNNVDIGAPACWAWARDKDFPGYVGRTRFKGTTVTYDEDGAILKMKYGDKVYAEYILELVRRVNLMLGLMRGTVPTKDAVASINARSSIYHKGARSLPSARIRREHIARTNINVPGLDWYDAVIFEPFPTTAHSIRAASMERLNAAGISKYVNSKTLRSVTGRVNHAQISDMATQTIAKTNIRADITTPEQSYVSAESKSFSSEQVSADQAPPISTSAQVATSSSNDIAVESGLFRTADAHQLSYSNSQLAVHWKRRIPAVCTPISRTASTVEIYLAIITRLRMYAEFELSTFGYAFANAVRDILLQCNFSPLIMGYSDAAIPDPISLHLSPNLLFRANALDVSPERLWLYGLDRQIDIAKGRNVPPSSWLLNNINAAVPFAAADLIHPHNYLLHKITHTPHIALGLLQSPTGAFLHLYDRAINTALTRAHMATDAYLHIVRLITATANATPESPQTTSLFLQSEKGFCSSGKVETPMPLWLNGFLHCLGICSEKLEAFTDLSLFAVNDIIGNGGYSLETPNELLLTAIVVKEIPSCQPVIDPSTMNQLWAYVSELYIGWCPQTATPNATLLSLLGAVRIMACCPVQDNPLAYLLHLIVSDMVTNAHPQSDAPRSCLMRSVIVDNKMDSHPRLDDPRRVFQFAIITDSKMDSHPRLDTPLYTLLRAFFTEHEMYGCPKRDAPRHNYLFDFITDSMMDGHPSLDMPREHLMKIVEWVIDGHPRLETPRNNRLYVFITEREMQGYPRLDKPRYNRLLALVPDRKMYAYPRLDSPRHNFLFDLITDRKMDGHPRIELPERCYLRSKNRIIAHAADTVETPEAVFLRLMVPPPTGYTDPKVQLPAGITGHLWDGMMGTTLMDLQNPSLYLLHSINDADSIVCWQLDDPWVYQAHNQEHSYGCLRPMVRDPDGVRMAVAYEDSAMLQPRKQNPTSCLQTFSESLLSVANVSLLLKRIAHGIFCSDIHGTVNADVAALTRMQLYSENLLTAIAHAAVSIRKGIKTSGIACIESTSTQLPTLLNPTENQMRTAFQFSCSSGSTGMAAIYATASHGIVYLTPAASIAHTQSAVTVAGQGGTEINHAVFAQGFVIGLHPAFGIAAIPDVTGYGASRVAVTVNSAGQPVVLELDVSLGGITGRFAHIRMYAMLPSVYSYAHSMKRAVRVGCGFALAEAVAESAHANAASTTHGRGNGSVEFNAVCGGYVRMAQAPWDNPVQTGSNLHITGAWNVQQADHSLYIE